MVQFSVPKTDDSSGELRNIVGSKKALPPNTSSKKVASQSLGSSGSHMAGGGGKSGGKGGALGPNGKTIGPAGSIGIGFKDKPGLASYSLSSPPYEKPKAR